MDQTDEELLAEYRRGSPTAFEELVRRHTQGVYNFVLRLSGDKENAHDLTQDTFVKAWRALASFTDGARFTPWLFTIARNVTTDYMRKKKTISFSALSSEVDIESTVADDARSIEEVLDIEADAEVVTNALAILPSDMREILLLRYQEGLTFEEAASALDISINTAKSRGRRALLKLKATLQTTNTFGHPNL